MNKTKKNKSKTFYELREMLPGRSEWYIDALRRDIEHRGIQVPIFVDQDGNVIDGRNRAVIANELGILVPIKTVVFQNDDERLRYAISINFKRRYLSGEQTKEFVKELKRQGYTAKEIVSITCVPIDTVVYWMTRRKNNFLINVYSCRGITPKRWHCVARNTSYFIYGIILGFTKAILPIVNPKFDFFYLTLYIIQMI